MYGFSKTCITIFGPPSDFSWHPWSRQVFIQLFFTYFFNFIYLSFTHHLLNLTYILNIYGLNISIYTSNHTTGSLHLNISSPAISFINFFTFWLFWSHFIIQNFFTKKKHFFNIFHHTPRSHNSTLTSPKIPNTTINYPR